MNFARIFRLTRAEFIKLSSGRFFPIMILILIVVSVLSIYLQKIEPLCNAILLFAIGSKYTLKIAIILVIIFSSLVFAVEFDKGTIKNLFTRPVTRTEIYVSKCIISLVFGVVVVGISLYVPLLMSLFFGELGYVWEGFESPFPVKQDYEFLVVNLIKSLTVALPAVVACIFMGIIISTVFENSGNAIALAIIIYLLLDFLCIFGFLGDYYVKYILNYFPDYAFGVLRGFAEGNSATKWNKELVNASLYIPIIYSLLFIFFSYLLFRFKSVNV